MESLQARAATTRGEQTGSIENTSFYDTRRRHNCLPFKEIWESTTSREEAFQGDSLRDFPNPPGIPLSLSLNPREMC